MISKLPKPSLLKNVATLTTGSIIANFITIGASIFLTRLYTPEEIGYLVLFTALTIITTNIFTLGFELAIVHPDLKEKAVSILTGTLIILSSCVIFLFLIFLTIQISNIPIYIGVPVQWNIFLPLGILTMGIINIGQEWFNRQEKYNILSSAKIIQSFLVALPQIIIGYLLGGNIGLVLGFISGRLAASLYYCFKYLKNNLLLFELRSILNTLKDYIRYPKYVSPTLILDRLSMEIPYFLIPFLFGENQLGFFAIAYRVLSVPLSFLGVSIGQIFYQHLSSKRNVSEKLLPPLLKIWLILALTGVFPMGIILLGGSSLFEFVFGIGWGTSGIIAIYLVPMLYLDFISSPTGKTFLVINLEHYSPIFSIARILYITASIFIGFILDSFFIGILSLSLSRSLALIIQNLILFLKVRDYDSKLI